MASLKERQEERETSKGQGNGHGGRRKRKIVAMVQAIRLAIWFPTKMNSKPFIWRVNKK